MNITLSLEAKFQRIFFGAFQKLETPETVGDLAFTTRSLGQPENIAIAHVGEKLVSRRALVEFVRNEKDVFITVSLFEHAELLVTHNVPEVFDSILMIRENVVMAVARLISEYIIHGSQLSPTEFSKAVEKYAHPMYSRLPDSGLIDVYNKIEWVPSTYNQTTALISQMLRGWQALPPDERDIAGCVVAVGELHTQFNNKAVRAVDGIVPQTLAEYRKWIGIEVEGEWIGEDFLRARQSIREAAFNGFAMVIHR